MKKSHIGIKEIARTLGISVSTVSRALRDAYDVKPETKKRVLAAAKQLKYKPNLNAAALVSGSTRKIGIIIPFITNYYFSTVISGIQEIAYRNGYDIVLFISNDDPERESEIIRSLSVTALDGLLVSISSRSRNNEQFQELMNDDIPVVFFDRVPQDIAASKVLQDDFWGSFTATKHLIENGYKRIAHIAGPRHLSFTQNRVSGYLEALAKHHLPICEDWIVYSGFSQQDGYQDMINLLRTKEVPNAVFAVNDGKAVGAILALKEWKIQVGIEIGVVGFTNDPIATIIEPSLTTIEEPAMEIGRNSCSLLIKHISNKHFEPRDIILPGKLIIRQSSQRDGKQRSWFSLL